jgi:hypothetical protein
MGMGTGLRRSTRVALQFDVTLMRTRGNPVEGRTRDIGAGGMCVTAARPLAIDEVLSFELDIGLDGRRVTGDARVLREQIPNVYALRFEELSAEARAALERLL